MIRSELPNGYKVVSVETMEDGDAARCLRKWIGINEAGTTGEVDGISKIVMPVYDQTTRCRLREHRSIDLAVETQNFLKIAAGWDKRMFLPDGRVIEAPAHRWTLFYQLIDAGWVLELVGYECNYIYFRVYPGVELCGGGEGCWHVTLAAFSDRGLSNRCCSLDSA